MNIAQLKHLRQTTLKEDWPTLKTRDLSRSNDTRWNSVLKELRTLLSLRSPFEAYLDEERHRILKEKGKRATTTGTVLDERLSADDWDILAQYVKLLEPCDDATADLEGRPRDGVPYALFNVQTDLECIMESLTAALDRYKSAPAHAIEGQWHFKTQIQLALAKAEQYYALLDDSPAYLASTVLHPQYTWKFIESQWSGRRGWIRQGKAAVNDLWRSDYNTTANNNTVSPSKSPINSRRYVAGPNMMEEFRLRGLAAARGASTKASQGDEFERWCKDQVPLEVNNPLNWWRIYGSKHYPNLTQMALDMLSIPAMSDEPERLFSRLGLIITPRRNHLQQTTVQAISCLHSWDKSGLIDLSKTTYCT